MDDLSVLCKWKQLCSNAELRELLQTVKTRCDTMCVSVCCQLHKPP